MTISRFYIHTTVTFIAFGINHVIKRMILAERKQKILPHCIVSPNWTNTAYYVTAETISTFKRSEVYKFICFLLNVEFSNACRFRVFQCHFSTVSRFPFPRFQSPQCWHGRTEYWKFPAYLQSILNVVTNSSCWQCLCTLLFRYFISSYYSTRCWNLSLYHPLY